MAFPGRGCAGATTLVALPYMDGLGATTLVALPGRKNFGAPWGPDSRLVELVDLLRDAVEHQRQPATHRRVQVRRQVNRRPHLGEGSGAEGRTIPTTPHPWM